ncbi:MAG: response regulator [Syntrophaceae bacterium]|nr:response regulator [Syntrophaceae bacterium]
MTDIAKLLEAIGSVAWPASFILLIFLFRPAIAGLIESAKSRKFTLRLGGQELTMEEASEQQRKLIADLQAQVLEIKKSIEGIAPAAPETPEKAAPQMPPAVTSVLWVDDQPKNNSYFVQQLVDRGVNVELAMSTAEGLRMFDKKTYGVVISDMGRTEDGTYKPTAGLELLKVIRERNKTTPFIIYSSSRGERGHREAAIKLGATTLTTSPTEMFGLLQAAIGERG